MLLRPISQYKNTGNTNIMLIYFIEAMQKTHNAITFSDIETVMKAWLVKAKYRNAKQTTK